MVITLHNVLHILGLDRSLLSVIRMSDTCINIVIEKETYMIIQG